MRRLASLLFLPVLILALAACEDDDLPPTKTILVTDTPLPGVTVTETQPSTQIVMVVTSTPKPGVIVVEVTVTPTPGAQDAPALVPTNTDPAPETTTSAPASATGTLPTTPLPATNTPPPTATPLPAVFPTNVEAQVQIAEQVFERGRMFWIRHNLQIWVMVASADDPNRGDWYCYFDTFQEGEMEVDPNLTPPSDAPHQLYQPRRGFGKLWRSNSQIQEMLGWGITPEFELTSSYTYIAGGLVDQNGAYVPGPGEHRMNTLSYEKVSFFEKDLRGDCMGGTWRLTPAQ